MTRKIIWLAATMTLLVPAPGMALPESRMRQVSEEAFMVALPTTTA